MKLSEACDALACQIKQGVYDFGGCSGLAIQVFMRHIQNGETPKMALAQVKMELIDYSGEGE